MNVQVASGCIKKWYESTLGVSRCRSEILVRQGIAAMALAVVDETTTSKSGIKTAFLGATAIRDGRRFWRTYVERI